MAAVHRPLGEEEEEEEEEVQTRPLCHLLLHLNNNLMVQ